MASVQELHQTDRIEGEAEGFQTIARLHSLPTGTPECLAALPLRLAQDWRLRGSFVELIRDLQGRDPEFSLGDALAVLVLAVGGPAAWPNRRRALDEPIDLTAGFLASLDGWPGSDAEPVTDLDNPPDHDPRLDLAAAATRPAAAEATPQPPDPEPATPGESEPRDHEPASPTDDPAAPPAAPETPDGLTLAAITRALARLERGTVDLRLHLDSIDQRLSRMEPLLESVPTQDLAQEHHPTEAAAPTSAPPPAATLTPPSPAAPPPPAVAPRAEVIVQPAVDTWPPPAPTSPTPTGSPVPPSADPGPPPTGERRRTPRKDRFAAAMELPGSRSELHLEPHELPPSFPDEISAEALAPTPPAPPLPAAPAVADQPPPAAAEPAPAPSATSSHPVPAVPAPAPEAIQPAPVTPAPTPAAVAAEPKPSIPPSLTPTPPPVAAQPTPAVTPAAASGTPPAIQPERKAEPNSPSLRAATTVAPASSPLADPRPGSATPRPTRPQPQPTLTFGGTVPAADPADTPERSGKGPLLVGILAALLIALAAFLLLRGKPIPFLQEQPAAPTTAQPAAATPQETPAPAAGPSARSTPRPATPEPTRDRTLTARPALALHPEDQLLAAPTFVPEPVMRPRLVNSPPPLYPRIANVVGLEGNVTFEAIIAKDGTVDGLTVLGGQHLLRDAAANAVRQWRYQPFLVHGAPVEVRTIIHVNVTPRPNDGTE